MNEPGAINYERQAVDHGKPYRILSLDGGGIWGVIQLMTLIDRYSPETTGHEVLLNYDLVAANSGGSLTLGALYTNLTLGQALANASDEAKRRQIFTPVAAEDRFFPNNFIQRWSQRINWLWKRGARVPLLPGPRYRSSAKIEAIKAREGIYEGHAHRHGPQKTLRELAELGSIAEGHKGEPLPYILIAGFDAFKKRAKFFHSPRNAADVDSGNESLAQAIHGSTNAPVNYFDLPATFKDHREGDYPEQRIWDGGLAGYNNPCMAAVVEAFKLGVRREDMQVVSIGTRKTLPRREEHGEAYLRMAAARSGPGNTKTRRGVSEEAGRKIGKVAFRLLQMGYYTDTVSTMMTTVLQEPADGACYLALQFMSTSPGALPMDRFVRLCPFMSPSDVGFENAGSDGPEAPTLADEVEYAAELDFDLVADEDFQQIGRVFRWWQSGAVPNQPIAYDFGPKSSGHALEVSVGQLNYEDAMSQWRQMK